MYSLTLSCCKQPQRWRLQDLLSVLKSQKAVYLIEVWLMSDWLQHYLRTTPSQSVSPTKRKEVPIKNEKPGARRESSLGEAKLDSDQGRTLPQLGKTSLKNNRNSQSRLLLLLEVTFNAKLPIPFFNINLFSYSYSFNIFWGLMLV